jgi:A/G-specific adenine glycosylase
VTAPSPRATAALRRQLLRWYDRHRRSLPWRGERDPYRIWLSEVMLQQTRIAAATPYYRTFLDRFPTLESLAGAREADVLAAWAGLGYYGRARHLREAARLVVREHGGRVPGDPDAFARLPGVGRYTAGAVLSIAFDRPLPALDGNVARVLSRLCALPASVRDSRGAGALWASATSLVPMRRPGDWNQALMELGATVCTPRAPRCGTCPVRGSCLALSMGRVAEFPPPSQRRAGERLRQAVVLIERRGRLLVTRRGGPLLAGLWEPPGVELEGGGSARSAGPRWSARPRLGMARTASARRAPRRRPAHVDVHAQAAAARRALSARLLGLGLRARLAPTGQIIRYTITHRDIGAEVWRGMLLGAAPRSARLRWVDPQRPGVALTALARKVARLARRR